MPKRLFISIALVGSISFTGCSQSNKTSHQFHVDLVDGVEEAISSGGPKYDDELFEYILVTRLEETEGIEESILVRAGDYKSADNGKFYVATEGKLLIVDRDGVILKNLDIGADTIDSYSDGSKIIVAMTNGKAALIDLATDTIINNQIDMQTDNGAYKVSRIFNLLNNKIYVTQYKTRYVSNGTWEDDKGEIHYYPKTLVSDGFGALIDVQTNTLERRDALGTAVGNNAFKFDFYQPKNH